MATPLIVNVVELLRWPGTTKELSVLVDTSDFDFVDSRIVDEPVQISLHLEGITNGVDVSGTATFRWAAECRRCLKPLSDIVIVPLDEMYQPATADADPDAFGIEHDQINLLAMVRENILLSVPLGPLCKLDCRGFCPNCGCDLSVATCACDNEVRDARWSALDQIKGSLGEIAP